jgi:hypothetical protein
MTGKTLGRDEFIDLVEGYLKWCKRNDQIADVLGIDRCTVQEVEDYTGYLFDWVLTCYFNEYAEDDIVLWIMGQADPNCPITPKSLQDMTVYELWDKVKDNLR